MKNKKLLKYSEILQHNSQQYKWASFTYNGKEIRITAKQSSSCYVKVAFWTSDTSETLQTPNGHILTDTTNLGYIPNTEDST
jgi:hypothetical protein